MFFILLQYGMDSITSAQSVTIVPFISQVAGRTDWAKKGIVYDHLNLNLYYSVSFIQPDGSGYRDLTKNRPGCPQKNNGQPAFDPNGRYVVFQAEKDVNFDTADVHYGPSSLSTPGAGINCDLWVLDLQDSVFTRLTNIPTKRTFSDTTKYTGVLHPQFSHNGKKLLWGECIDGARHSPFGFWRLNISDFDTTGGFPHLINTMRYDSGGVLGNFTFLETSGGFSPDDSSIIYCANAITGQPVDFMDIYTFNFYTNQLINLTTDTLEYDEHSHYSYDGSKVLWMSSRGIPDDSIQNPKADYWLMNKDGTNKTRLTYFNDSTSADYLNFAQRGRVIASDNTWSPFGGDTALCYLQVYDSAGGYHQELVFLVNPSSVNSIDAHIFTDNTVTVFPNPASTQIKIIIPFKTNFEIEISNILGETAIKSKNHVLINVSTLTNGIYFLKATFAGKQIIKTFIKD